MMISPVRNGDAALLDATTGALRVASIPNRCAMPRLRLQLFGPPQAWRGEQSVRFKTRKTLSLLAYLASTGGPQPREHLAALLWPDNTPQDARHNLRAALTFLRQSLGEGALTATQEAVGLAASALRDLDLRALRQAQQIARSPEVARGLCAELERALALYRGAFLEGLEVPDAPEFETWLTGQRAYWLGVMAELLERLAPLQAEACDYAATRSTLERWVALEPGEERAWERLLALELDRGYVGARRVWTACRSALADLNVQPGPALLALAARLGAVSGAECILTTPPGLTDVAPVARVEPPLVGRAVPLATLRRAFARALDGLPQVVVVQGEAGIGKTRLAGEFLAWARARGADVLSARAFAAAGRLPYAPLVAALRQRLERENAPEDLLSDLWLAELARLLPELRERYPDLPPATPDPALGPGRLFEAVARLGLALAARAPLVIVLDDLQWADRATRELLPYLVRRWEESGARMLVLLAVRTEDVGSERPLGQWLGGLEREAATTWLELERLTPQDMAQLVTSLAGPAPEQEGPGLHDDGEAELVAFGQWLARATDGRPCHMTHLLQSMLEEGVLRLRPVAGDGWGLDVRGWCAVARLDRLQLCIPA